MTALTALLALAAATTPVVPAAPSAIIALPLNPVVPASQRACATRTASGLGYSVLRAGTGGKPGATDFVLINYIGYLAASGATFDQAMSTPMTVDGVIPGFGEGLALMPAGSIYRICVPAALGYGAVANGPIPASSDLVFQVELLDFRSKAEVEASRASAVDAPPPPAPTPPK